MCPPQTIIHPEIQCPTSSPLVNISDRLPADSLSQGAYKLAKSVLPPALVNHSVRVFLFAEWFAHREQSEWATPAKKGLLCTACLLHDVGCAGRFDGPQRFEVEGADAAATFLRENDVPQSEIEQVWQAIALHTTPGIAERISSCARLVRQAVLLDFGKFFSQEAEDFRSLTELSFPRLAIEKILGDIVVEQAERQPTKAPHASWPGVLLRAKREEPEWEGVNKAF